MTYINTNHNCTVKKKSLLLRTSEGKHMLQGNSVANKYIYEMYVYFVKEETLHSKNNDMAFFFIF